MPEGKPPTPLEDDAEECLHCAIVDMVEEQIAAACRRCQPCSPDRGEPRRPAGAHQQDDPTRLHRQPWGRSAQSIARSTGSTIWRPLPPPN